MKAEQIGIVMRLAERTGGALTVGDIERLFCISRTLHRLDEAQCSYGLTNRQERRAEKLEAEAMRIADKAKALAYHQGDPRGCSLYIIWPADLRGFTVQANYTAGVAVYD